LAANQKSWRIEPSVFAALDGWQIDDHVAALSAFRLSARRHLSIPYKQRQIAFDGTAFDAACRASLDPNLSSTINAKAFFEYWFEPHLITGTSEPGKITGYYEPIIEARRKKGQGFETPFLQRPDDLVELSDEEAQQFDGMRFGKIIAGKSEADKFAAYVTRADIDGGALAGRNLEIAYVQDPVDAFFAHVQGCARLQFKDTEIRVTYDGKSGHAFTAIGRALIEQGEIDAKHISMQSIRDWLKTHPQRVYETLHLNQSYIFFREEPVADDKLGPVAAAKVPVSPGRSIAVDRTIHAFGLPFYISAPQLKTLEPAGFNRLMIAQDTGSAILGVARADLFIGSGDAAGAIAGSINYPAQFFILLPRKGYL
jgi:membrane-bound lytic murein transglycosylase A